MFLSFRKANNQVIKELKSSSALKIFWRKAKIFASFIRNVNITGYQHGKISVPRQKIRAELK